MFKNYLIVAFRNLSRNRIYSFINIAGLSLGLACAMLIILYVKDEVSYDRFHNNVNTIYRVVTDNSDKDGNRRKDGNTGYMQGPGFKENVPGIQSFVRVKSGAEDMKTGNDVYSQDLLYVDSLFFSMFSFPLINGNAATCLADPYAVVISETLAKKQFGTTDAVGKIIQLKGDSAFEPYRVSAVAKKVPQNSSIQFDMLLPLKVPAGEGIDKEDWFNFFLNTFVMISPNTDVKQVQKQMQHFYKEDSREGLKIITEKFGDIVGSTNYMLQPYADMHLNKELPPQNGLTGASNPVYSYILSGIALFILFIACINFVNLTIARSVKRAKEIGIRKVVGGERKQLIFQFLGESFLLCFVAFAFAMLIVVAVLPVFNELSNKALAIAYLFDVKLVSGYIALFIITGMLAGFYPALILSSYNPVQTLYSRFMLGGKNYLQKSLVVLQFTLASFLIIATFTIYTQFNYLTTEKLGYDDSNLVTVTKQNMKRSEAALLTAELLKNPDILMVASKNSGGWGTSAKVNGDSVIDFAYETVSETYLPTLKIPLVQGRNFSADFPDDASSSVIVNESFVKKAGWKNPVGQEVNFWYRNNEKYKVVGVVKDYHYQSLNQKIGVQLFTMKAENEYGMAFIKIKPNSATASLKHIEASFKKLFPFTPYSFAFKDQKNIKEYEAEAKWKQIMLFSAVLTIFISCIGLFGLSVLSAEKRTKEIGIRKVLGASVNSVVTILSKDFVKLVLLALLIAIPFAWVAANKWLQNYPYKISLSWQLFVLSGLLVIVVALLTVSFQAVKAAVANPVKSLRTE
jgi:putative ABC transport system permease protein